jgi:hypothetical protein
MAPDDSLLLIHLEDFLGGLPFSPAVDVMATCSGLCRTIALKYSRGKYSLTFLGKATVGGGAAKGKSTRTSLSGNSSPRYPARAAREAAIAPTCGGIGIIEAGGES